ncbi:hypothetical protein LBMAG42_44420 [Deltaproteobacteria bacterium]|nr:hypothetical protein LBMAG42_44420 [Deltaproteobacteria bacterium]
MLVAVLIDVLYDENQMAEAELMRRLGEDAHLPCQVLEACADAVAKRAARTRRERFMGISVGGKR